jgi:hypothetical protein
MRTDGLGYTKHSLTFVLVLILLMYAFPVEVEANQLVQVTSDALEFVMETKPSADEYIPADKTITLSLNNTEPLAAAEPSGETKRTTVTYRASELVCDSTGMICPAYIEASIESSTGYDSGYQSLDQPIVFLRPQDDWAKVTFRLAPEAWGPAGTYEGWLKADELGVSPDIRVTTKIDKYIGLSVDKTSIEIEADHGPGSYLAKEKVTAQVAANHKNWTLIITGEPLELISSSTSNEELLPIEPSNVFVKLEGDPDDRWMNLYEGMTLRGSSDFEIRQYEFVIKVETELQHTAGTYSGKLRFTISE